MYVIAIPNQSAQKNSLQWKHFLWRGLWGVIAYLLLMDAAHAVCATVGGQEACMSFFDQFDNTAKDTALASGTGWLTKIRDLGKNTFYLLATLEFAWAAIVWVMEKDDMNSFASEIMQRIMFISFFYALLQNAPEWMLILVDSFRSAGTQATGVPPPTTDGMVALGFAVVKYIWHGLDGKSLIDILKLLGQICIAVLVTIIVVVAYVICAAQLLCLNIESYVMLAAGAIFLALGSSRWTNDYVTKYMTYALTVGMRLLVLILILGLTQTFVNDLAKDGAKFVFAYEELFKIMAMAIMTALLGIHAPEMASAMMSGGIGFSGGNAVSGAKSAAAVAAAPFKVTAAVGGVAASGVQGAYHINKLAQNSTKFAAETGGSATKAFVGTLAKEAGRSLLNMARGKDTSHGFRAYKQKDGSNQRNAMGDGHSKKPGFADRANRAMKAKTEEAQAKNGGTVSSSTSKWAKPKKP